jgi:hypothetical protein
MAEQLPVLSTETLREIERRFDSSAEKRMLDERRAALREKIDLRKACHSY